MNPEKIHVETYGCSASFADSEIIVGILKESDFKIVPNSHDADLNLIVTCTVKSATSHKMEFRIHELTKLDKPLVVAGCMPKTERNKIERINPKASLIGPNSIDKLTTTIKSALTGIRKVCLDDSHSLKLGLPRIRKNPVVNIVEIANGCLGRCSFCQVKVAKGALSSYPVSCILDEVRRGIKDGCKEVWLTSQDNSCYGMDIGTDLPHLIKEVSRIEEDFQVRVGMMNPLNVGSLVKELVDAYSERKIFKFLHLPFQSGSDKILMAMHRGYKVNDFLKIVGMFREEFPSLTLSTDIIVGFPGEDDDDLKQTVQLLEEVKPDKVNLSKFGPRPGTEAATLPLLSSLIINQRSVFLHDKIKRISYEKNKIWIGWNGRVLIDEVHDGVSIGRNYCYKPIVIHEPVRLGSFANVSIVRCTSSCLYGKLCF